MCCNCVFTLKSNPHNIFQISTVLSDEYKCCTLSIFLIKTTLLSMFIRFSNKAPCPEGRLKNPPFFNGISCNDLSNAYESESEF